MVFDAEWDHCSSFMEPSTSVSLQWDVRLVPLLLYTQTHTDFLPDIHSKQPRMLFRHFFIQTKSLCCKSEKLFVRKISWNMLGVEATYFALIHFDLPKNVYLASFQRFISKLDLQSFLFIAHLPIYNYFQTAHCRAEQIAEIRKKVTNSILFFLLKS